MRELLRKQAVRGEGSVANVRCQNLYHLSKRPTLNLDLECHIFALIYHKLGPDKQILMDPFLEIRIGGDNLVAQAHDTPDQKYK